MASKLDAERMAVIGGDTQADGTPLIRRTLDIIVKADTQGSAEAVALDVSDRAAIRSTVEGLIEKHGKIDILVNLNLSDPEDNESGSFQF